MLRHGVHVIAKQLFKLIRSITAATRVPQTRRTFVVLGASSNHIFQLNLITGTHDLQLRDATKVGQIITSVVRGPIISNQTSTVHDNAHRQVLYGNIVHNGIIATLQEGTVDAAERFEPFASHTGSHGDGVLLGNADIKCTLGEATTENIQTSSTRHGSSYGDYGSVLSGLINERVGKDAGEARGDGRLRRFELHTSSEVEFTDSVHLIRGSQGGRVAMSLLCFDVKENRLRTVRITQRLENAHEVLHIVTIYGTHVVETKFLKQCTTRNQTTRILINPPVHILKRLTGQQLVDIFQHITHILKRLGNQKLRCVSTQLRGRPGASRTLCTGRQ
mmetsp:Transcript_7885/g.11645  ORF Transcript_7885/g.11645 Transcript_7885/m.11645 type:complete len:333 (-) Transcript_7885:788-1786(-)